MPVFALTIFIGAFLLFQVQPLIGKYILPWFGGGPGVWTTCMLFFQMLLLVGYAYAHFSSRWLRPRAQAVLISCYWRWRCRCCQSRRRIRGNRAEGEIRLGKFCRC